MWKIYAKKRNLNKNFWRAVKMSQEVKIDAAIIKRTQETLGRIINAPSLTDKLLNRPPVQFIQDIVKSVQHWDKLQLFN